MFTLNNGWKHCLLASMQDRRQLCLQSYCYNKIRKERISKIPLLHNFLYNLKKLGNHMPFRKEKERTSKDNSSNYSNSQGMKRFIFAYWLWFLQQWWRHICYAAWTWYMYHIWFNMDMATQHFSETQGTICLYTYNFFIISLTRKLFLFLKKT